MNHLAWILGATTLTLLMTNVATAQTTRRTRVLVWDERQPEQSKAYDNFLGNAIADHLRRLPELDVTSVGMTDPDQGLGGDAIERADVIVWWGHRHQREVKWDIGDRITARVQSGKLGFIVLHSAHWSTPFIKLMNARAEADALASLTEAERREYKLVPITPKAYNAPKRGDRVTPYATRKTADDGSKILELTLPLCVFPAWRADGKPGHITTALKDHPIAQGLPPQWDIPQTEMYDEPFHVPSPDAVIFEERWDAGEHFRSGLLWSVGQGKVFYFRPGHETYPIYRQSEPLKVIENAVRVLAPK